MHIFCAFPAWLFFCFNSKQYFLSWFTLHSPIDLDKCSWDGLFNRKSWKWSKKKSLAVEHLPEQFLMGCAKQVHGAGATFQCDWRVFFTVPTILPLCSLLSPGCCSRVGYFFQREGLELGWYFSLTIWKLYLWSFKFTARPQHTYTHTHRVVFESGEGGGGWRTFLPCPSGI